MEGETVDDFTMCLGSLVVELGTLEEVINEQQVVQKLLRVVPKHLSQVAVAIKVTQDLSKRRLEDVNVYERDEVFFVKSINLIPY
jgi:hypothetical protein